MELARFLDGTADLFGEFAGQINVRAAVKLSFCIKWLTLYCEAKIHPPEPLCNLVWRDERATAEAMALAHLVNLALAELRITT